MRVLILPEAAEEFEDAADYYERQQAGLGHRFRDDVDHHIRWIRHNAGIPRLRQGRYRRVNLKIFPYYVAYPVYSDSIWILAIAHGHR